MASSKYLHDYPPSSGLLLVTGCIGFFATILVLFSFSSPFWLESYTETYSNFKRLGLWEVCFDEFRFPKYQYDKKFHGCHSIYSQEYRAIQEWILPGWFMAVQAFMTLSFIFCLATLGCISVVLMRYWLRYEIYVVMASCILECLTAFCLLLSIAIFGARCFDRSWLLYPNFNHLSWSFAIAVIADFFHIIVAICLYFEIKKARLRKRKANTLVMKMDSASSFRY